MGKTFEKSIGSCTKAYILVWCSSILIHFLDETILGPGSGGLDVRPLGEQDYQVLLPLILVLLCSLLMKNKSIVLPMAFLTHAVDLAIRWERMPVVWDHEQWAMQVEMTFLLVYGCSYLFGSQGADPEHAFLYISRTQFALMYFAATFWKLNSSFLNVSTSCGTVLILELVSTYLPAGYLSPAVVQAIGNAAPYMTLGVEGAISFFMFRNYQALTIALAVLFHLSIFFMPVNSAGGFSMDCQIRFVLFFSSNQVENYCRRVTWTREIALTFSVSMVLTMMRFFGAGAALEFGFLGMCVLSVVYFRMLQLGGETIPLQPPHQTRSLVFKLCTVFLFGLTLTYCFGTLTLGLQQMGAPSMYGNLRYYGGSNHYLAPLSVLPDSMIFGGGIVKVVFSTCTSLNRRLAYIPSEDVFPEQALLNIRSVTKTDESMPIQFFPLCESNPHSRKLLGEMYDLSNPSGSPNFLPFYIPISEVRKALAEEESSNFIVKVVDAGTSKNLQTGENESMLVFRGPQRCEMESSDVGESEGCLNDRAGRLILEPPPETLMQRLAAKLLYPYPQFVGMQEEICMS